AVHLQPTDSVVANAFMDNVYKLYGLPLVIVSDRDKSDGQTEVVNRFLETYLRCMTGGKPKEWSKWFSLAEYWYNTNFHTAIQTTPYEAVYGQPPPNPIAYIIAKGEMLQQALKVLDKKLGKVGNSAAIYVLIQWSNSSKADATWELHSDIVKRFPDFPINS
ncbi:reverse transcriptase, partial [Tanacetum coccineum]